MVECFRINIKHLCQLLIVAVGLFFGFDVQSQDVCTRNLEDAQESFDQGKFIEVDTLLRNCIKSGFTKQERIEALELLALSKLYLDDMDMADSVYLELLTVDPEHKVNPLVDPPDLIFLHQSFRTEPLFTWSAFAGLTYSFPSVIHSDFIYPTTLVKYNDQPSLVMDPIKEYQGSIGYIFGVNMDAVVYRNVYVGLGLNYSRTGFKYKAQYLRDIYATFDVTDLYYESTYKQNLDWLSVPVYVKYQFEKIKFKPYAFAGASYNGLIRSRANDLTREKIAGTPETKLERGSANDIDSKNRNNISINLGVGFMYKTSGIDYLVVEFRYSRFIKNITSGVTRYGDIDNQTNIILYGIALDDYSLTSFDLSLKFLRPFYKPKKIK
jgi:opacity protein-like surface antigen